MSRGAPPSEAQPCGDGGGPGEPLAELLRLHWREWEVRLAEVERQVAELRGGGCCDRTAGAGPPPKWPAAPGSKAAPPGAGEGGGPGEAGGALVPSPSAKGPAAALVPSPSAKGPAGDWQAEVGSEARAWEFEPDLFFTWFVETDGGRSRSGLGLLRSGVLCLLILLAVLYTVWDHAKLSMIGMRDADAPVHFTAFIDGCNMSQEELKEYRVVPFKEGAVMLKSAAPLFRTYHIKQHGRATMFQSLIGGAEGFEARPTAVLAVGGVTATAQMVKLLSAELLPSCESAENTNSSRLLLDCENGVQRSASFAFVQMFGLLTIVYYALTYHGRFFNALLLTRMRGHALKTQFFALAYAAAWYIMLPEGVMCMSFIIILDSDSELSVLKDALGLLFLLDIGASLQSSLFSRSNVKLKVPVSAAEYKLIQTANSTFTVWAMSSHLVGLLAFVAVSWFLPEMFTMFARDVHASMKLCLLSTQVLLSSTLLLLCATGAYMAAHTREWSPSTRLWLERYTITSGTSSERSDDD